MPRHHRSCSVHQEAPSEATLMRLSGGLPPLLPELAAVLPAAPDLVDHLVAEFAPTAATLSTPQAYWVGLNGWMTDRLSGPLMEGPIVEGRVTADQIGAQA